MKLIRKWCKSRDGVTAIEFSLLAMPFMMLVVGIIEISIMFAGANLLEGATGSAARMVKTGQIQQGGDDPQVVFQSALCGYAVSLINCNNIKFESVVLDNFVDYDANAATYDEDGQLVPQGFDAGGSGDIILIRTAYQYQMMTPLIGSLLGNNGNTRTFTSTVVMQVEPYEFIPGGG